MELFFKIAKNTNEYGKMHGEPQKNKFIKIRDMENFPKWEIF